MSGKRYGKVKISCTSNKLIKHVTIENMDGTLSVNKVNSNSYEKDIEVVFDKVYKVSFTTEDGLTQVYDVLKYYEPPKVSEPQINWERMGTPREGRDLDLGTEYDGVTYNFSWADIGEISKIISDTIEDDNETNDITMYTYEFELKFNDVIYKIGVGDRMRIEDKIVRIIGFNHDDLVNTNVYGGTNTKAGISFEYVTFLEMSAPSSNYTSANSGGWGAWELRKTLNSENAGSLLSNVKLNVGEGIIKQVKKQYIKIQNVVESITISNDYLWLLSCSEIWNNGKESGYYGNAITKEGNQYIYYKIINATWNISNNHIKKPIQVSEEVQNWWLRSHHYYYNYKFCMVGSKGICTDCSINWSQGVAPGFCV